VTLTSTLRLALLAAAVVVVLPFIIAAFWLTPTTKSGLGISFPSNVV
jgi:hypothetical protein